MSAKHLATPLRGGPAMRVVAGQPGRARCGGRCDRALGRRRPQCDRAAQRTGGNV